MSIFSHREFDQHERVSFFNCPKTGLRAIIALHNTNLGPAIGGCRMWPYESDDDALEDVLRLSRGMTYKAAITGLPLGGGKSVIIGDARKIKTPEMMQAMGRAVETFAGQYMIAEDVGTIVEDMNNISKETKHVVGTSTGNSSSGDPSPTTAYGIYVGLKSAVRYRLNKDNLKDVRVAVQGLGNVGYNLCKLLHDDGATLTVTDMDPSKVERANKEFGATSAALKDIYDAEADVFAPCALGAILNDENIARLNVSVVAGAANNQLAEDRHGDMLKDKGILYAPDYVINAGGLIGVYFETQARMQNTDFDLATVRAQVDEIDETSQKIFKKAEQENVSTSVAADRIAEERFKKSASCMAA